MEFIKVKTRKFLTPKDDFYELLDEHLPPLKNGDVLLITSKVLAIHQGRTVLINEEDKNQRDVLAKREANRYIDRDKVPHRFLLTITESTLIASAGIDKSNGNGYFVLWPKNTNRLLKEIVIYLKKKYKLNKLAAIATDSHLMPLRAGVIGISMGFYGMEPIFDYRGTPDIFGRKLKVTRTNIVDALAATGVLLMGEGKERTPMLIIRGADMVKFTNKNRHRKLIINPEQDIYWPLLKAFKKNKNVGK
jgi:F420-0:gamma-glutamyl ligase